ncbi:MFS transporter [Actinomadura sp. DC4]|uniref:MFS transporter n=1 Tax=Actinomadura sp. DC4 TaxID=3055069 RepID=UPI0025B26DC7|nr:MFS transporter [Actinomadura sp. DC4]MDN3358154.1 MFS transporter [Actinomadura sp. DC4]
MSSYRRTGLLPLSVGVGVSAFGAQLTQIGLAAHFRHQGPTAVSLLFVAGTAGGVLGGPIAGWLSDRFPNRPQLIGALLAQGAIAFGMTAALARLPLVALLIATMSLTATVTATTVSMLALRAAPQDQAVRVYSLVGTASVSGSLTGTVLGGLLAQGFGIRFALVIDGVTFLVQALLMARSRLDRRPGGQPGEDHAGRIGIAGLRHIRHDPVLLGRLVSQVLLIGAVTIALVDEIFLVTTVMGQGTAVYGVMVGCWGTGMLAGSRGIARIRPGRDRPGVFVLASLGLCAALLLPALVPYVAANGVAWTVGGASMAVTTVMLSALARDRTPEAAQGRVLAGVNAIRVAANGAGTGAAGVIVTRVGPRWTLVVAASLAAIGTAQAVAGIIRRRERPRASAPSVPPERTAPAPRSPIGR